jgi:hypothetical protein
MSTNSLCSLQDVMAISGIKEIVLGGLLLKSTRYFLILSETTSFIDLSILVLSHRLRFHFVCCSKEVMNGINRPVVSLLGTRVSGTSAEVVPNRINLKLPTTASRECHLLQGRYISTDTRAKKCLSKTSRPDLISVMRPDLSQPTYGLEPKYVSGDILLLRL